MSDDDSVARYQRPPRKGQFKSGQSGNPRGRPKGSRNIRTYLQQLLAAPILVKEDGKTRKILGLKPSRSSSSTWRPRETPKASPPS